MLKIQISGLFLLILSLANAQLPETDKARLDSVWAGMCECYPTMMDTFDADVKKMLMADLPETSKQKGDCKIFV